ncbi:MAG: crossover junction endodeoxyribonuclease RuvC [Candidatus Orphnella occulta]|nr:crossover junction endodeoxyribonuclease RuvC [Candidatus Orphnella occulta]MDP8296560.1 crossover junction endodeoxyribonuclease RuvC [Candidatus Orphnella occulta]
MKILGIDPGLDTTGYGLIDDKKGVVSVIEAGVLKTSCKDPLSVRIKTIYYQLVDIIDAHKPDVCIIEQLYSHYKHPMTAILMGHARGVILFCCSQGNVEVVEYPAKTPKRAITGNGNASKSQVQRVVNNILNLKDSDRPLDVTDALALCLTYVYHAKNKHLEAANI